MPDPTSLFREATRVAELSVPVSNGPRPSEAGSTQFSAPSGSPTDRVIMSHLGILAAEDEVKGSGHLASLTKYIERRAHELALSNGTKKDIAEYADDVLRGLVKSSNLKLESNGFTKLRVLGQMARKLNAIIARQDERRRIAHANPLYLSSRELEIYINAQRD